MIYLHLPGADAQSPTSQRTGRRQGRHSAARQGQFVVLGSVGQAAEHGSLEVTLN